MIGTAFVVLATYVTGLMVKVLPISTGLPSEIQASVTTMGGYVRIIDTILPVTTLATIIGIVFTLQIAIFSFKTFKWLVSYLPFIGGKG